VRGVRILLFGAVIVVCALTSSRAQSAASDNQPPPAGAMEAFAEGKRLYDAGDKKSAVEKFKEAYRLSKNALLLYNIAFVYDELSDETMAVHYYRMFVDKSRGNPKATANRKLAEDRLKSLEESAKPAPPSADEPKDDKKAKAPVKRTSSATALVHQAVDTAEAGVSLPVVADAPQGWKVTLYWRRAGEEMFQQVPFQEEGPELIARVPPRGVAGAALHYYIEATDAGGQVVGHSGDASSPNLVEIQGDDTPEIVQPREVDTGGGGTAWTTRRTLKWAFTGAAALAFTGAVVSYVTWGNYRQALRDELTIRCGDTSCAPETDYELELRDGRNRWKLINWITLGTGVATAGAAGYFWWADRDQPKKPAITAVPVVSPDYVGASAVFQF
jgi:hypothetical protein